MSSKGTIEKVAGPLLLAEGMRKCHSLTLCAWRKAA